MYPLFLFINVHGAGDGHFVLLINTSQLMLVTDEVSQNLVTLHNRGTQRKDEFTWIYLRVGTNGLT